MVPLSVLDLSPVAEGSDVGRSLGNTLDLARHAERLGLPALSGWPNTTTCRGSPAPPPRW